MSPTARHLPSTDIKAMKVFRKDDKMDKESGMSYFERMRSNSVIAATQYQQTDTSTLLLLESVAYSLANIADSLKSIEGSLESISDNIWTEGSNL